MPQSEITVQPMAPRGNTLEHRLTKTYKQASKESKETRPQGYAKTRLCMKFQLVLKN